MFHKKGKQHGIRNQTSFHRNGRRSQRKKVPENVYERINCFSMVHGGPITQTESRGRHQLEFQLRNTNMSEEELNGLASELHSKIKRVLTEENFQGTPYSKHNPTCE